MDIVNTTPWQSAYRVSSPKPGRHWLTLVVKATYAIVPGGVCTLAAEQAPCGTEVHQDRVPLRSLRYSSDMAVFKPRGEALLAGTCHVPGGKPATVSGIAFRVGNLSKAVAVFGDREWSGRLLWTRMSEPLPFVAMPLRWERSFGGPGSETNPHGVGMVEVETPQGRKRRLPNIEDPRNLITSPDQHPEPVGVFPLTRAVRARKHPGAADLMSSTASIVEFPADFPWEVYNSAPRDQQITGYFRGQEEIALRNLHPAHELIRTRLPGQRARFFLKSANHGELREIAPNLDTITVDTDAGLIFCVWRAAIDVEQANLSDIACALITDDAPGTRTTLDDARRLLDPEAPRPSTPPPQPQVKTAPAASLAGSVRRAGPAVEALALAARAREEALQRVAAASARLSATTGGFTAKRAPQSPPAATTLAAPTAPPADSAASITAADSPVKNQPLPASAWATPSLLDTPAGAAMSSAPRPDASGFGAPSTLIFPDVPGTAGASLAAQLADQFASATRPVLPPPIDAPAPRPARVTRTSLAAFVPTDAMTAALPDYLVKALKGAVADPRYSSTFVPAEDLPGDIPAVNPPQENQGADDFAEGNESQYTFVLEDLPAGSPAPTAPATDGRKPRDVHTVIDLSLDAIQAAIDATKSRT